MKNIFLTLAVAFSNFSALFAQTSNTLSDYHLPSTPMNTTATSEEKQQIMEYLHAAFPDSRSISEQQVNELVSKAWKKGILYGFDTKEDIAIYAIASYVLGENFDIRCGGSRHTPARYLVQQPPEGRETWSIC